MAVLTPVSCGMNNRAIYIVIGCLLIVWSCYFLVVYNQHNDIQFALSGSRGYGSLNGTRVVVWSNDFHIGPIQDLKHLLRPLGVRFIDKSLSGHCHLTNSCGRDLKVINSQNGMDLADPSLISKFYDTYRNDAEMKSVNAFVCFHPSSMCELFMPFGKSIIVIASTRYELGRFGGKRWKTWNDNISKIAADPKNVVAGNNLYDAKYIQYFTGIEAQVIPSFCGYIDEKYIGNRDGYLLAPIHKEGFQKIFMDGYADSCRKLHCDVQVFPLRTKYAHYEYSDLTAHKGIIYVPYQVSVMSLFEQYRMNIPLFFPSKNLLTDWQYDHMIMNERTWDGVYGKKPAKSAIPPHFSQIDVPDPNCETNKTAIRYWIEYADFYTLPHITYYESYEDLVRKLQSVKLEDVSKNMKSFNKQTEEDLLQKWKTILSNIM